MEAPSSRPALRPRTRCPVGVDQQRLSLLLARLGLAGRAPGLVVTAARSVRVAQAIATQTGLPLLASVKHDVRVPRARERGQAPPAVVFASLAALAPARATGK